MKVQRAMTQMLGSRMLSLVVMAVNLTVLARLLSPAEFGVFAVAMALYEVARTVALFGLDQILVRERNLTVEQVRGAAGLSLVLAGAIATLAGIALVLLPDGLVGGDTGTVYAILVLALLEIPVTLPTEVRLRRRIEFGLISVVTVVRLVADGAVAITLAWMGFGAPALAAGFLASRFAGAALLLIAAPRDDLSAPSLRRLGTEWRASVEIVASGLLPKIGELVLVGAVGAFLGMATLGLYHRANSIRLLLDRTVLEGINPTVLPAISRALAAGVAPQRIYLMKVDYLAALCWPAFALIALLAEPLVFVLLGSQWSAAIVPLQLLALTGLAVPITKMSLKLFVALNLTLAYLRIQTFHQVLRTALAVAGALLSLEAVCAGIAVALLVKALAIALYIKRTTGYASGALARLAGRAGAVTVGALAGPAAVSLFLPSLTHIACLALSLLLAGLGWLATLALVRHRLWFDALAVLAQAKRRRVGRDGAQAKRQSPVPG